MAVKIHLYFTPTQLKLFQEGDGPVLASTRVTGFAEIHVVLNIDDIEDIMPLDAEDLEKGYKRFGNLRIERRLRIRKRQVEVRVIEKENSQ